jgi:hypothetical protein
MGEFGGSRGRGQDGIERFEACVEDKIWIYGDLTSGAPFYKVQVGCHCCCSSIPSLEKLFKYFLVQTWSYTT